MRRPLVELLVGLRPDIDDPERVIRAGVVLVEGSLITNPRSMVEPGASIVVREATELRGSAKLRAALDAFAIAVRGRVCLDVGASAGGFTSVLLGSGAVAVYAVDVGHGQLLGSLRQDPRVRNLEATNVAELDATLIDMPIDLVTVDLSYLSLGSAVNQLDRVAFGAGADLVGLVKPMFELRLAAAPTDDGSLQDAISSATASIVAGGWAPVATMRSPVTGAKGAIEGFVHARRSVDAR